MKDKIRKAAVAGRFYNANKDILKSDIDRMAEVEQLPLNNQTRALIVPHAGYMFSGQLATQAIKTVKDCNFRRVFILAPSHCIAFRGLALADYTHYQTPFGNIQISPEINDALLKLNTPLIRINNQAHIDEHAIEVELPVIQHFFRDIEIIPIVCGQLTLQDSIELSKFLTTYWQPENLWLISSDFTHYGNSFRYTPFTDNLQENIRSLDFGAIKQIINLDTKGFYEYITKTQATICGRNPITLLLSIIEQLNNKNLSAELLQYTTSGDIMDDFSSSVSYATIAFNLKR